MILGMKLKKDYFDELERRLRMLEKGSVRVGVFDNEPREDTDGYWSNVTLFSYLSAGNPSKNLPARPALELAFAFNPLHKSPLKKELTKYFSNINRRKGFPSVKTLLKAVGEFYRNKCVDLIGMHPPLAANSDYTQKWKASLGYKANAPMLMTGQMMDSIAFKVDGTIFEYGNR